MSSVFSDPDGESTRRLNEDIARVTAPRKLPVNWEAAHRKWPEFYSMPKSRDLPILDDDTDTRPLSPELKENKPPVRSARFTVDDTTQDIWNGSARTRSEMQPRADTESDLSSLISKSPARVLSVPNGTKNARQPSPLSKTYTRSISESHHQQRRTSLTEALEQLRANSASPRNREQRKTSSSPQMSSAKSSLTAVAPSPAAFDSPGQDMSHVRSFFMPDVSHLGDFVTGTLRFSGSMKNGVPIFVKHGNVHDRQEKPHMTNHADVDGLEVPEDEEKIFVSMDMIREEIISLQDHYEKVQEYASNLQSQVEVLEAQLKARPTVERRSSSERPNEQLLRQKESLEIEITTLQSRLEQASRKISLTEIEKDSLIQEKDRAVRKLQEACDDINKLTRKLSVRERELENSQRIIESTEQHRLETDTLKRDMLSLKHGRDALELENTSLRTDNDSLHQEKRELEEEIEAIRSENESLRRKNEALLSDAKSLRSNNKNLATEDEDLRDNLDGVQHELDAAIEQVQSLHQKVEEMSQERTTLREDNNSLVRHNEKYFEENRILRRENSGFEQSIHALRDENLKLKEDVDFMKQQMDHCRPIPKEDLLAQLDDETGENMTSAFFIPDITMNSNDSEALAEITDAKGDLFCQSLPPKIPDCRPSLILRRSQQTTPKSTRKRRTLIKDPVAHPDLKNRLRPALKLPLQFPMHLPKVSRANQTPSQMLPTRAANDEAASRATQASCRSRHSAEPSLCPIWMIPQALYHWMR
uniref:PPC89 centrosome localisation domain-containing protein n=1 Tax=Bionectria ochroleuca TaxID=29856 RepID=A0A8H7NNC0_BIOOC